MSSADHKQSRPTVLGRPVRFWGAMSGCGYACQGNLLVGKEVLAAMVEAFQRNRERPMAAQLLAALQAGDAAGGDRRGKQAAGMLILRDRGHWTGSDRCVDLRVDDHADPVGELTRIMTQATMLA